MRHRIKRKASPEGYSDFLTAPDTATVIFRGNAYTDVARLVELTALRCADVTLAHGFRYFVVNAASDIAPRTFGIYKPALMVAIKMSNNEQALEPLGMIINDRRVAPKDAAFLSQSLRQFLGIKS